MGGAKRYDVFISCAAQDKDLAVAIKAHLEDAGVSTWCAAVDLKATALWDSQLADALEASSVLLLLLSEASNGSRQTQNEAVVASELGLAILPLRVEDFLPTGSLRLQLARSDWLDLFPGPIEEHFPSVLSRVRRAIHGALADPRASDARPCAPPAAADRASTAREEAAEAAEGAVRACPHCGDPGPPASDWCARCGHDLPWRAEEEPILPDPLDERSGVKVCVLGAESLHNLRLAEVLRGLTGAGNVLRQLEPEHMLACVERHAASPLVVFVDLFSLDTSEATQAIERTRDAHPDVVFCMYLDPTEWTARRDELHGEWPERFEHYFRLHKVPLEDDLEPTVRAAWRMASTYALSRSDSTHDDDSDGFRAGLVKPTADPASSTQGTVFVSYSRADWEGAVSGLVDSLRSAGFRTWVDRSSIVGGNEWLDVINEALRKCDVCVLALSPQAMASKWVKLEYRYFLYNEKPVLPVLIRPLADIPFELAGIQRFEYSADRPTDLHEQLSGALVGPVTH